MPLRPEREAQPTPANNGVLFGTMAPLGSPTHWFTSKGETHGSPMQTLPSGAGRRLGMGCDLLRQEEAGPLAVGVQARWGTYPNSATCISIQGRSKSRTFVTL